MPSTLTWPPALDEVKRFLRVVALAPDAEANLQATLDAAVAYVQQNRPDLFLVPDTDPGGPPVFVPDSRITLGTITLTARWYNATVNTAGVDAVSELGAPPSYALDANVAQLLGVWRYRRPSLG